jgi:hypothetical protein
MFVVVVLVVVLVMVVVVVPVLFVINFSWLFEDQIGGR